MEKKKARFYIPAVDRLIFADLASIRKHLGHFFHCEPAIIQEVIKTLMVTNLT